MKHSEHQISTLSIITLFIIVLFTLVNAQDIPPNPDFWKLDRPFWDINIEEERESLLKPQTDGYLNLFIQPSLRSDPFDYHGSGDGNGDGVVNIDDQQMIGSGQLTDYRLDVNGDGIVNIDDKNILGDYLNGEIEYLPAWWNELKTRDERIDWFQKMANIYAVEEKQGYVDRHYATEFYLLMHGIEDTVQLHSKYTDLELGLANLPVYYLMMYAVYSSSSTHLIAINVGHELANFEDWIFYDPIENNVIELVDSQFHIHTNTDYTIVEIFEIKWFTFNIQYGITEPYDYPGHSQWQNFSLSFQSNFENSYSLRSYWSTQKFRRNYIVNPFHQPNIIYDQLNSHGGGDYDGFGIGIGDQQAAQSNVNDFRLDVSGDNTINQQDADIIGNYINSTIDYLPAWWNFLQTRQGREDWFWNMANIYTVDQKQYNSSNDRDIRYVCVQFALEFFLRMRGAKDYYDIAPQFDDNYNGNANIPVYYTTVYGTGASEGFAHAIDAVLVGNDPLNFNDWLLYEPQVNNESGISNLNMSCNIYIHDVIRLNRHVPFWDINDDFITFVVDSNNTVSLQEYSDELILQKPTLAIKKYNSVPKTFYLKQNFPNPFNPITTIHYFLSEQTQINITIFDMLGRTVNQLVSAVQPVGHYSVEWNGKDRNGNQLGTGIYFYKLKAGDFVQTKKMLLLR